MAMVLRWSQSGQPVYVLKSKEYILSEKICSHPENMSVKYIPPLTPLFLIAKLGYAGVYLLFLFLLQNIDCGEAVLTCTHNLCFEQKYEKYHFFQ